MLVIVVITGILYINYNLYYDEYKIYGEKIYGIDMNIRVLKDIVSRETVEIKSNNVEIEKYTIENIFGSMRSRNSSRAEIYYLNIDDGVYQIPISNVNVVKSLLYENKYGDKRINTITVYNNSKLIKAINGINLSDYEEKITEFEIDKQQNISIDAEQYNWFYTVKYEVKGATLEEFLDKNNIHLCYYDENNKVILNSGISVDRVNILWPFSDGTYRVSVCKRINNKEISNSITYKTKDEAIYEIVR